MTNQYIMLPREDGDYEVLAKLSSVRDKSFDSLFLDAGFEIREGDFDNVEVAIG